MKKTMLVLTMAAGLMFAQDGKRMEKFLGLSAEQKPQVEAILKDQRTAVEAARKNNASKEDIQNIRKQTHDKLAGVLSAEQMQKFDNGAKKMRHRRGKG